MFLFTSRKFRKLCDSCSFTDVDSLIYLLETNCHHHKFSRREPYAFMNKNDNCFIRRSSDKGRKYYHISKCLKNSLISRHNSTF